MGEHFDDLDDYYLIRDIDNYIEVSLRLLGAYGFMSQINDCQCPLENLIYCEDNYETILLTCIPCFVKNGKFEYITAEYIMDKLKK